MMMKINEWIRDVHRMQMPRQKPAANLRCDMAERLIDFDNELFSNFINSIEQEDIITYPSYADYEMLKEKIAKFNNVAAENIMLGTGSDACIKSAIHLTCNPDSEIVSAFPCFPMYFVYGAAYGASFIKVPYNDRLRIDLSESQPIIYADFSLENMMSHVGDKTRLVILANPNSPFGDYKTTDELEVLCVDLNQKNVMLLIDEAYADFAPGSAVDLALKYDNVVISKTFSKALGAAGARVGYMVGCAETIDLVSKVQLTYPVAGLSLRFASFLLDNVEEITKYSKETIRDRDLLCGMLESSNFDVLRSHTNSIHFHEGDGDNSRSVETLSKHGVGFKSGQMTTGTPVSVPGDNRETWIRLSVGPRIHESDFINDILTHN